MPFCIIIYYYYLPYLCMYSFFQLILAYKCFNTGSKVVELAPVSDNSFMVEM